MLLDLQSVVRLGWGSWINDPTAPFCLYTSVFVYQDRLNMFGSTGFYVVTPMKRET
jgi:hypothetical protein